MQSKEHCRRIKLFGENWLGTCLYLPKKSIHKTRLHRIHLQATIRWNLIFNLDYYYIFLVFFLRPFAVLGGCFHYSYYSDPLTHIHRKSKEKGILQGSAPLFYRKEPLEPRRELRRMLQAGLGVLETSRRIGKSTSFVRKNRDKMQTILIEGNEQSLQDWLSTLDLIRAFMNEKDEDDRGAKATKRMKTVVRMVSGYLNNPNAGFPKPTTNDIEEYYNNFGLYKVKAKR